MEDSVNFLDTEKRVFDEINGVFYIGGEKITPEMRDVLREQANYIERSNIWEIVNATVVNEAYRLALIQSQDFNNVISAKMLHHWAFVMRSMMRKLGEK